jgi:predicted permease
MRWIHQLAMKVAMLFGRRGAAAHLDDELRFHLDRQVAENLAAGMNAEQARTAALRSFGNPALLRDQTRATWSWASLDVLGRDLRYGARTLRRTPGFTLIAVAVMALCIGAATSLFTIVRSVLLRPLDFRDPDSLVMVYEHFRDPKFGIGGFNYNPVSPGDYYDWRAQTHGFEDMAAWHSDQFNLTGEHDELPEVVAAGAGSWNLFPLLGVQPAYGRSFNASEDRVGAQVAILSWNLFVRRFAGDPAIVGRTVHLDGKPYTVVGVLPKSYTYPSTKMQIWVPYASSFTPEGLRVHDGHQSRVVARLRPNVSVASALAQVSAVQYRLHMQYLGAPVCEDAVTRTLSDDLTQNVKKPILLLFCAVGCMLLIGCLNVANLLVARGAARQKEVAIRGALGAGRRTLIREQLVESVLICAAGGVGGVSLSLAGTRWLAGQWKDLPTAKAVHVDGVVLAFACGLVFAAALLAGLLPAISSTGKAVYAALQASTRGARGGLNRTAMRKALLTVEIAVTVVLLIAAGLLAKSFLRLRTTDIGCVTDHVLTLTYSLPDQKYGTPDKMNAFNESLLARLRALPGVKAVALGTTLPDDGYGGDDIFHVVEHPPIHPGDDLPDGMYRRADPDYFKALEIPLLSGRYFTSADRGDQVYKIIVSQELVKEYFQGENAIGKHLWVPMWGKENYEIIGVVGDTQWRVGQRIMPTMYAPMLQGKSGDTLALAVRTAGEPLAMAIPVQKQFAAIDPELPVSDVYTMEQIVEQSVGGASFSATLVLAFAVLSLVLASVGLYGVLSYLATQRMAEIGIRLALGAQREQVLRLMLADGLRPALVGLACGLAASAALVRLIRSVLYQTEPLDPLVFAAVAATLLLVAAVACLVPAWRASRLDPVQALRTE